MKKTNMMSQEDTISAGEKSQFAALKNKLAFYGYNGNTLGEITTVKGNMPLLEHRFKDNNPFNTLVKLFLLGVEVERVLVREVFNSEEMNAFSHIGILNIPQTGKIHSLVKIYPYKEFNFLCDFSHSNNHHEPVYCPHGDSIKLTETGIRIQFDTVLDLCTGTGIQAIFASKHSSRVVGADINPRAIRFANLNLILNSIDNVEFRLGNLYEPIKSSKFDFVIANPPFVICPSASHKYRDGGKMGDEVLNQILDDLPEHLQEGGYCQILTYLYEFNDISQVESVRKFACKHSYETLLFSSPAFDKYQLAFEQYSNLITNYKKYKKTVIDYLDFLDEIQFKEGYLCVITFKNSGRFRFKRMVTINRPVSFDLQEEQKLKNFGSSRI